jgi:hypothetical protein
MAEEVFTHVACGPSSASCKCQCPNGPCEHKWDGEERVHEYPEGGCSCSVTCSRCGMDSMSHDMWVMP